MCLRPVGTNAGDTYSDHYSYLDNVHRTFLVRASEYLMGRGRDRGRLLLVVGSRAG
jgi:hypothetical protein